MEKKIHKKVSVLSQFADSINTSGFSGFSAGHFSHPYFLEPEGSSSLVMSLREST